MAIGDFYVAHRSDAGPFISPSGDERFLVLHGATGTWLIRPGGQIRSLGNDIVGLVVSTATGPLTASFARLRRIVYLQVPTSFQTAIDDRGIHAYAPIARPISGRAHRILFSYFHTSAGQTLARVGGSTNIQSGFRSYVTHSNYIETRRQAFVSYMEL